MRQRQKKKKSAAKASSNPRNLELEDGVVDMGEQGILVKTLVRSSRNRGNDRPSHEIEMQRLDPDAITPLRRTPYQTHLHDSNYSPKHINSLKPTDPFRGAGESSTSMSTPHTGPEANSHSYLNDDPYSNLRSNRASAITHASMQHSSREVSPPPSQEAKRVVLTEDGVEAVGN
jgi:hypothetical protein